MSRLNAQKQMIMQKSVVGKYCWPRPLHTFFRKPILAASVSFAGNFLSLYIWMLQNGFDDAGYEEAVTSRKILNNLLICIGIAMGVRCSACSV